jgi:hypothetical protein
MVVWATMYAGTEANHVRRGQGIRSLPGLGKPPLDGPASAVRDAPAHPRSGVTGQGATRLPDGDSARGPVPPRKAGWSRWPDPRVALIERCADIDGAALGEGAFSPGPALWVAGESWHILMVPGISTCV